MFLPLLFPLMLKFLRQSLLLCALIAFAPGAFAAPVNALKNPQLAAVQEGAPAGWIAFEGGFVMAAGAGYKGSDAVTMTRAEGEAARGISQVVTLNQKVAKPITLAGWSRAQNVSGEPDNGYALFADLTYADGTNGWGFNAPFKTGNATWNRAELTITPDKPIQSLSYYAMFREHTGQVWFSDLALETDGAPAPIFASNNLVNRLVNGDFSVVDGGVAAAWAGFEGGYDFDPQRGYKESDAITATRVDGEKGRGAAQVVTLNQTKPEPIVLAGWSRARNVSGDADADYALYADLVYADGSNGWGFNAPFATGTADWNFATLEIKPEKAVKSLTFYAMFRNHSGQVWFSDLAVKAAPATVAMNKPMKLIDVEARKSIAFYPYKATIDGASAAMRVVDTVTENLLRNAAWQGAADGVPASWQKWGEGFALEPTSGRAGRPAAMIENAQGNAERGIWQDLELNQTAAQSLVLSGWSRAENVAGTPDVDYSLYADLVMQDGREIWGQSAPFLTGTHDYQRATLVIAPGQPIKSIKVYALFRKHTGKAWFSDLSLGAERAPDGGALFDGLGVKMVAAPLARMVAQKKTSVFATQDGLSLTMNDAGAVSSLKLDGREISSPAPSGFLARDVGNHSDIFALNNGSSDLLKLKLESKITAFADHLVVEGSVADLSGKDRAITLFWALPVEASGWKWGQTMRREKPVGADELSNTVSFFAGANGQASLYPLANIHDGQSGLTIALDPDLASQNRLAINGATRQFTLAYDFGLTPEKPSAKFRFVIYRTNANWGFRDALAKMGRIFPGTFEARGAAREQGLWMPFTDVSTVQGWRDFGFRFREAAANIATDASLKWDDENGILTFRYFEPSAWWMPMDDATPRNYENALRDLQRIASDAGAAGHEQARAVLSSGYRAASGRYAVIFRDEPWAKGAVWSLNPDPQLPGANTGASLGWDAADKRVYADKTNGTLDGEYLDSLEGYVTANLNFDRAQFKVARAPLTFETASHQPAQHKALLAFDYVRAQSRDVRALGKLMFANSVPSRYTFLAPALDVMGTETDWMLGGQYRPDDDDVMSLRRAMSGTKPYLLLQNTDYDKFTPNYVEKYMQRSLFYGMFPGFFSANAAESPYWENPKWYNRDRPLFQKYVPLVKRVAQAGWQPLTLAKSDNPAVWIERYGANTLTIMNSSSVAQQAQISLQAPLKFGAQPRDSVSGLPFGTRATESLFAVELAPEQVAVLELK